jgi:hypothetical protein
VIVVVEEENGSMGAEVASAGIYFELVLEEKSRGSSGLD